MRKISFIPAVFFLTICISCIQKSEFIELRNVAVAGIKDSLMIFTLDYVAYNPNNVRTTLKESKMEVFFEDERVGYGYVDHEIILAANDTVVTPVRCEVPLAKLSEFYPKMMSADSTFFKLRGNSKIGFMFSSFDVKINEEVMVDIKNLLKKEIGKNLNDPESFKIKGLRINSPPTLNQTAFEMQLSIKNNLPFDYTITDLQIEIHHKDKTEPFARWKSEKTILQQANSSADIPVEVVLDNLNIVKQMNITWLLEQKADFDVSGIVHIEINGFSFEIPIQDRITFEF